MGRFQNSQEGISELLRAPLEHLTHRHYGRIPAAGTGSSQTKSRRCGHGRRGCADAAAVLQGNGSIASLFEGAILEHGASLRFCEYSLLFHLFSPLRCDMCTCHVHMGTARTVASSTSKCVVDQSAGIGVKIPNTNTASHLTSFFNTVRALALDSMFPHAISSSES